MPQYHYPPDHQPPIGPGPLDHPKMQGNPVPADPRWSPPPRRRSKGPLIALIVTLGVLLCVGGGIVVALAPDDPSGDALGVVSTPAASSTSGTGSAPRPAAPAIPGLKTPVRVGDFQFTVNAWKCGIARVGSDFLNATAKGTYCRADATVINKTKSPQTFWVDNLTANDATGRTFAVDTEAVIYGNESGDGWMESLNPDESLRAFVFFDVAKGTKIVSLTFDAGLFTLAEDVTVRVA